MGRTTAIGVTALLALASACGGGDDLLLPGAGEPATITVVQGDQQSGRVGEALAQPLIVSVTDASGRPVDGATVVFSLTDAAPGASITPDTTTSNSNGQATANVVLGTRPGDQAGQAEALGGSGMPTATTGFTATALPENANGIAAVSGQDQSGQVGTTLASPLVVLVSDPFGNPISGVAVAWSVDGGGAVSETGTTTGADGTTSVVRTLGPTAGAQHTFATVDGLAGSPVTFTHTATAGAASGVTIVAGNRSDRSREHRAAAGPGGPGAGRGRQCGAVRRGHLGAPHRRRHHHADHVHHGRGGAGQRRLDAGSFARAEHGERGGLGHRRGRLYGHGHRGCTREAQDSDPAVAQCRERGRAGPAARNPAARRAGERVQARRSPGRGGDRLRRGDALRRHERADRRQRTRGLQRARPLGTAGRSDAPLLGQRLRVGHEPADQPRRCTDDHHDHQRPARSFRGR